MLIKGVQPAITLLFMDLSAKLSPTGGESTDTGDRYKTSCMDIPVVFGLWSFIKP